MGDNHKSSALTGKVLRSRFSTLSRTRDLWGHPQILAVSVLGSRRRFSTLFGTREHWRICPVPSRAGTSDDARRDRCAGSRCLIPTPRWTWSMPRDTPRCRPWQDRKGCGRSPTERGATTWTQRCTTRRVTHRDSSPIRIGGGHAPSPNPGGSPTIARRPPERLVLVVPR